MTSMPLGFKEWTADDLGRLPDDGLQYELLDGVLHVGSWPTIKHQVVRTELWRILDDACPPDLFVLATPVDWRPDPRTSLQPDVMVFPTKYLDRGQLSDPLTLAIEVLSPSTRHRDLVLKHAKYASAGVASYWVVDPDGPSILAGHLVDGRYRVVGEAWGDQRLELDLPFPVALTPTALISRWQPFSTV
jgi:Uma2 family endonuclease